MNARLEGRGRLESLPMGRSIDRLWRRTNERLAIRGAVTVGRDLRLGAGVSVWAAHGLTIGECCAIGRRSTIHVDGVIGDFLMTGPGVSIVGRNDHAINQVGRPMLFGKWVGDRDPIAGDAVTIGDDVWIGAAAVVLGGVSIGTGVVVGAGSVVVHDVAEFDVVVGNPARKVGERFSADQGPEHKRMIRELTETRASRGRR